jgi:Putative Ig domain
LVCYRSFVLSGLLLACGGGGNTPPPTPLSVTTTSLPSGQTTVAYSATLSATGGTPPYNWTVKSGALPAGLSLSAAGAITGTPTTAGAASVSVQVSDSAAMQQTAASGNLTLAISGGTLKITSTVAATGTVGTPYNFQLQATGGVPPYTWAAAMGSTLPAGLSLSSAGVVTGTPTAAGTFNPNIAVTDETTANTTSEPVSFTINPSGTPLPDGNYTFQFNGNAPNVGNPVAINGSFEIVQGTIGPGFYSENELNQQPTILQPFSGGSISVATNGLGQLVLNIMSGGNITFEIAVPASALTAGNDTDIRIIEFDDSTGSVMSGSGVLKTANFNAPPTFKGGYAFSFSGYDTHSQPEVIVGSFQADGNGNITIGSVDINDAGTVTSFNTVTGPYSVGTGNINGLITLKFGSDTLNYGYYQVSPTELLATSSDMTSTTIPMVSGIVLQQTGPFTNASFTGANVLEMTGFTPAPQVGYLPEFTLGLFASSGNGNVTASYDWVGSLQLSPYTATYTVAATTARTPITSGSTTKAILYLVSNTKAFVLSPNVPISSGLVEAQTGSPFSNASLKGNYLGDTIPWPTLNVVSLVAADGAGNAQFTSNSSDSKNLQSDQKLSGTYSVDTNGRAVFTVTGDTTPRIFYVVSPTKTVFLSGDGGGYLSSFEQ